MKIQWNVNASKLGLWANIPTSNPVKDIMLSVFKTTLSGKYLQMVWVEGEKSNNYSQSEHECCISAMVHAEAAATELADEMANASAVWQEV